MEIDKAKQLIESTKDWSKDSNRIYLGIQLIVQVDKAFDTNAEFCAEHEEIYVGNFRRSTALMTEDQVSQMAKWGWHESQETWHHYT